MVLAASLLGLALAGEARAQQPCYFLECPGGAGPSPQQQPPRGLPNPPQTTPPKQSAQPRDRPRAAGEVCGRAGDTVLCASSVLGPQQGNTYVPLNVIDGRLETAWVEGKPGDGIGEWIVADFGKLKRIRSIQIMNGYHKNEDVFRKNNRVREAELAFSDGSKSRITLEDRGGVQSFTPENTIYSSWVQVSILSVYKGTRHQDTAITELRVETSD